MGTLLFFLHPVNSNMEADAICDCCDGQLFDGIDDWTTNDESGSVECSACQAEREQEQRKSGYDCCPVEDCKKPLPADGLVCWDCYFHLTKEEFKLLVRTRRAAQSLDGEHSEHLRSQFEGYLKSACRQIFERKNRKITRSLPSERLPNGRQPS